MSKWQLHSNPTELLNKNNTKIGTPILGFDKISFSLSFPSFLKDSPFPVLCVLLFMRYDIGEKKTGVTVVYAQTNFVLKDKMQC